MADYVDSRQPKKSAKYQQQEIISSLQVSLLIKKGKGV